MKQVGGVSVQAPPTGQAPGMIGRALGATVAVYVATLCIFLASNYIQDEDMWAALLVGVPMVIGDALISLPLVAMVLATEDWPLRRRGPLLGAATIVTAVAISAWDAWVRVQVGTVPPERYGASLRRSLSLNTYLTAMFAAIVGYQTAFLRLRANGAALLDAREAERHARMESLRLQLNPHFLFNTLNALSSLVVTGRPQEAEEMIGRLSDFLRNALSADPGGTARLEDEIEVIEGYLEIERVRFAERLRLSITLPRALTDVEVPQLLLQPLVENAMKYGVAGSRRPVCVEVSAHREADTLVLRVADDASPTETVKVPGTGIGLENIRRRLALHYGAAAELVTRAGEDGFTATIRLPLAPDAQASPSASSTEAR